MAASDRPAKPDRPGAQGWVPPDADVEALRAAAPGCRGCELWAPATQVVVSTGDASARVVLVGEQPGDVEDREGVPFVGPAGKLLMRAVDEASLDRREVYLTNAVKHFRFTPRGKRRIHQTPDVRAPRTRPRAAGRLRGPGGRPAGGRRPAGLSRPAAAGPGYRTKMKNSS